MTRTARASFPRATNRDRSESKSGLDKSLRKGGAGGHNWGSLADERDLEDAAYYDEETELASKEESVEKRVEAALVDDDSVDSKPPVARAASNSVSSDDAETAKKARKNVFKHGAVDLADIARSSSSAVSVSP